MRWKNRWFILGIAIIIVSNPDNQEKIGMDLKRNIWMKVCIPANLTRYRFSSWANTPISVEDKPEIPAANMGMHL
jgi:hypothetical protein